MVKLSLFQPEAVPNFFSAHYPPFISELTVDYLPYSSFLQTLIVWKGSLG